MRRGVKGFLLLTASIQLSSLLQTEVRAQKYQASCVREMHLSCVAWCEGILIVHCSYTVILLAADGGVGPEVPGKLREGDG